MGLEFDRLWVECKHCGEPLGWFSVEIMEEVEIYGWIHRYSEGCRRGPDRMEVRVLS